MTQLNRKLPTFAEIMEQANESTDPVEFLKERIREDGRVSYLLGYAMNPKWKIPLPDGIPPYRDVQAPSADLATIQILHLWDKFACMFNHSTQKKKEEIFIRWLENMHTSEVKLLCAIKDKKLHKEYKRLNEKTLVAALGWDWESYSAMKKQK